MNIKSIDTRILPIKSEISSKIYKRIRKIKAHNRKDYTGQKFGMLMALKFKNLTGNARKLKSLWEFKCDCGNITTKIIYDVVNGKTKSCGCLNRIRGKGARHWKGYEDIPHTYFSTIKNGALSRKLKFNITIEYIWKLFIEQNRRCYFSGIELEFNTNNFKNTASLDRIDSSKGYVESNVQWVHKTINFMKQNLSDIDFINWCKKVTEHHA